MVSNLLEEKRGEKGTEREGRDGSIDAKDPEAQALRSVQPVMDAPSAVFYLYRTFLDLQ